MKILRGSSIIEIVIATALISISIIAALSLTNSSQKQNTNARDLAEANKYATQAVDWARNERNSLGWATIASMHNGPYCISTLPTNYTSLPNPGSTCGATDFIKDSNNKTTKFQRTLSQTKPPVGIGGRVIIEVIVTWEDKTTRQIKVESELTEW